MFMVVLLTPVGAMFVGYWAARILAVYGVPGVFTVIGGATAVIIVGIGAFGPADQRHESGHARCSSQVAVLRFDRSIDRRAPQELSGVVPG